MICWGSSKAAEIDDLSSDLGIVALMWDQALQRGEAQLQDCKVKVLKTSALSCTHLEPLGIRKE